MAQYEYSTKAQRHQIIAEREALGETMISDEFIDGKRVMAFEVLPVDPPVAKTDWKAEFAVASTVQDKVNLIAQRLGMMDK